MAPGAEGRTGGDLVLLPVQAACRTCQTEVESEDALVVCPQCGKVDLALTGGDALVLAGIEYPDPAAPSH